MDAGGGTFQAHALPLLGTRNQKKKGLFGEALILTTSHLVVLVIIL